MEEKQINLIITKKQLSQNILTISKHTAFKPYVKQTHNQQLTLYCEKMMFIIINFIRKKQITKIEIITRHKDIDITNTIIYFTYNKGMKLLNNVSIITYNIKTNTESIKYFTLIDAITKFCFLMENKGFTKNIIKYCMS